MKTITSLIIFSAGFISLATAVNSVNITLYAAPVQYTMSVSTDGIPTYTPVDDVTSAWHNNLEVSEVSKWDGYNAGVNCTVNFLLNPGEAPPVLIEGVDGNLGVGTPHEVVSVSCVKS